MAKILSTASAILAQVKKNQAVHGETPTADPAGKNSAVQIFIPVLEHEIAYQQSRATKTEPAHSFHPAKSQAKENPDNSFVAHLGVSGELQKIARNGIGVQAIPLLSTNSAAAADASRPKADAHGGGEKSARHIAKDAVTGAALSAAEPGQMNASDQTKIIDVKDKLFDMSGQAGDQSVQGQGLIAATVPSASEVNAGASAMQSQSLMLGTVAKQAGSILAQNQGGSLIDEKLAANHGHSDRSSTLIGQPEHMAPDPAGLRTPMARTQMSESAGISRMSPESPVAGSAPSLPKGASDMLQDMHQVTTEEGKQYAKAAARVLPIVEGQSGTSAPFVLHGLLGAVSTETGSPAKTGKAGLPNQPVLTTQLFRRTAADKGIAIPASMSNDHLTDASMNGSADRPFLHDPESLIARASASRSETGDRHVNDLASKAAGSITSQPLVAEAFTIIGPGKPVIGMMTPNADATLETGSPVQISQQSPAGTVRELSVAPQMMKAQDVSSLKPLLDEASRPKSAPAMKSESPVTVRSQPTINLTTVLTDKQADPSVVASMKSPIDLTQKLNGARAAKVSGKLDSQAASEISVSGTSEKIITDATNPLDSGAVKAAVITEGADPRRSSTVDSQGGVDHTRADLRVKAEESENAFRGSSSDTNQRSPDFKNPDTTVRDRSTQDLPLKEKPGQIAQSNPPLAQAREGTEALKHPAVAAAKLEPPAANVSEHRPAAVSLSPDLISDVHGQIAKEISLKLLDNISEMRVMLKPESLGEVTVNVRMDEHKMVATIDVSQPNVRAAVESNLPQLREALVTRGIQVDRIDVLTGSNSSTRESDGQPREKGKPGSRRKGEVDQVESYDTARYLGYNTMDYLI